MQRGVRYDVALMQRDMAERGWQATDVAAKSDCAVSTVTRFLNGDFQTAKTAKKIAKALRRSVRRYIVHSDQQAIA